MFHCPSFYLYMEILNKFCIVINLLTRGLQICNQFQFLLVEREVKYLIGFISICWFFCVWDLIFNYNGSSWSVRYHSQFSVFGNDTIYLFCSVRQCLRSMPIRWNVFVSISAFLIVGYLWFYNFRHSKFLFRSKTCPQCRTKALKSDIRKLFLNTSTDEYLRENDQLKTENEGFARRMKLMTADVSIFFLILKMHLICHRVKYDVTPSFNSNAFGIYLKCYSTSN